MKRFHFNAKSYLSGFITAAILISSVNVFAAAAAEKIEVVRNAAKFTVNGKAVSLDSFTYKGSNYAQVKKVAELCGKYVSYNQKTNTIDISDKAAATEPGKAPTIINTRGNTVGNTENGGIAAQQGEWIYYSNGKLCKMKEDGSSWSKICDDDCKYINVIGDYIYYSNISDGRRLYKIKTDGTERTKMFDDECSYISVIGNWIYFRSDTSGETNRINTDGSGAHMVMFGKRKSINVVDDWYYFIDESIRNSPIARQSAANVNFATDKIFTNGCYSLNVIGDWVYYLSKDFKLHKMKKDGSIDIVLQDSKSKPNFCINVADNWIYFQDINDEIIYKVRTDGKDKTVVTKLCADEHELSDVVIVDKWIFLKTYAGVYMVSKDGKHTILTK